MGTLHDRLAGYDEQVSAIYRPRASSTTLMRELASLHEAERRFKQAPTMKPLRARCLPPTSRNGGSGGWSPSLAVLMRCA